MEFDCIRNIEVNGKPLKLNINILRYRNNRLLLHATNDGPHKDGLTCNIILYKGVYRLVKDWENLIGVYRCDTCEECFAGPSNLSRHVKQGKCKLPTETKNPSERELYHRPRVYEEKQPLIEQINSILPKHEQLDPSTTRFNKYFASYDVETLIKKKEPTNDGKSTQVLEEHTVGLICMATNVAGHDHYSYFNKGNESRCVKKFVAKCVEIAEQVSQKNRQITHN